MARRAIGYDIDPLARLVAQVKCRELDDKGIREAYETVVAKAKSDLDSLAGGSASEALRDRVAPPEFHNRDYWFDPDVSGALAVLSYHIGTTDMADEVRDFLWVGLSSTVLTKKSVANARDITHSRHHHWEHEQLPDVLSRFEAKVNRMRRRMTEYGALCNDLPNTAAEAHLADARNLPLANESVDVVFTSPPYATALDYPRAHFLAIPWMRQVLGVTVTEYRENGRNYIGTERGRLPRVFALDSRLTLFHLASSVVMDISKASERQAKLIQRYFLDMSQVLSEIHRVLKPHRHAIIVVCPSHIRKVRVATNQVLAEIASALGLMLEREHTRTISKRRRLLPYMQHAFGERMSTEYVLILKKR